MKKTRQGSASVECENCEKTKVSKIKLDDAKSKRVAIINNTKRVTHIKHKMDGGHIKNMTTADWMISKPKVGDIIVELKGCDVAKAIKQVSETAEFIRSNKLQEGRLAALILCTEHPGLNTKMQRLIEEFMRRFRCPIHIRNKSDEYIFENVLSFNGPEKP